MKSLTGMVKLKVYPLIIAFLLAMPAVYTQQHKAAEATKKKEQIDRDSKKAYETDRKKTLKHRREIQTKETRKRMDEADSRAQAYNRQNDKKWWEKILKRKHHR
jgi:hypothetical protein